MSHGIPQARSARTRTSHEIPGRVHALVEEWGTTQYSRVALLPNYDHLVAGAVVSFMRSGRIALALDEPAGPPSALRGAVRAFSEHCRERGLHPAWVPVSGERLGLFLEEGFRILPIGLEGRVPVQELNLDESRFRSLRQSVRRAVREGVRVEVWTPPHGDDAHRRDQRDLRPLAPLPRRARASLRLGLVRSASSRPPPPRGAARPARPDDGVRQPSRGIPLG